MPRPKRMRPEQVEHLLSVRGEPDPAAARPDHAADPSGGRWSHTHVWAQAAGRVGEYGTQEWSDIAAEQDAWERRVVGLHTAGTDPSADAAADLAEEHRRSVERWYFTCPPALHRQLVDALHDDARVRARYDRLAEGTADFIQAAVAANAERAAG